MGDNKWDEQENGRKGKELEETKQSRNSTLLESPQGIKTVSPDTEGLVEGEWRGTSPSIKWQRKKERRQQWYVWKGKSLLGSSGRKKTEVRNLGTIENENVGEISTITRRISRGKILCSPAEEFHARVSAGVRDSSVAVG
ncbi:hypothetical protein Adt_41993 [Abeliophyllum distichum]|uniref:Uncharacterized protein n=1 Tax=Abeliophyllum distichum TaxID=126358 RepID=A0ABD1PQF9_9LAMI